MLDLDSLRKVRDMIGDRHDRAHYADNYFDAALDELESTRAELVKVTAERDAAAELAVELKQILESDYNTGEYMSRDDAMAYVRGDIAARNPIP